MFSRELFIIFVFALLSLPVFANDVQSNETPKSEETIQVKKVIKKKMTDNLVRDRIQNELDAYDNTFALIPHKTNYILPITFQDNPNTDPYEGTNRSLMKTEVKFQVSFKVPVTKQTLFEDNGFLYFGYTSRSVWQAFNTDESSPFRDTNHEPEIMLSFVNDFSMFGAHVPLVTFGFSHQSNGREGSFSRSWNRLYMDVIMEYEDFYLSFKPWWRIPERQKENPSDTKGDDNPDIDDYYGYFELRAFRRIHDNELSIMLRNNLRSNNKGALEIHYSYPFSSKVRGYVQLFHGHGETLLDYNHKNSRIGVGFMLNNWL